MTKYTRSRDKLGKLVKQVFGVHGVSRDTKVIVLFLAATMPHDKFKQWINRLPQLNPYNAHFLEINALRCTFGDDFRNYLILIALRHAKHRVSSAELQRFIRGDDSSSTQFKGTDLCEVMFSPAYDNGAAQGQPQFDAAFKIADRLLHKPCADGLPSCQVLLNAYLACRNEVAPSVAANALMYALAQKLAQRMPTIHANIASKKMVLQALHPFIHKPQQSALLFSH